MIRLPDTPDCVAFAPDGKTIAAGSMDGLARLWDADTGREILTLRGHTGTVGSIAFSPDGKTILTASYDRTARLWDVQTGQTIRILTGHTDAVYSVAFAGNDRTMATGSYDGTLRLWDADYRDFVAYACTRVFRDLTEEERQQYNIADKTPTCPQIPVN
jgi:WD40 repeat protein